MVCGCAELTHVRLLLVRGNDLHNPFLLGVKPLHENVLMSSHDWHMSPSCTIRETAGRGFPNFLWMCDVFVKASKKPMSQERSDRAYPANPEDAQEDFSAAKWDMCNWLPYTSSLDRVVVLAVTGRPTPNEYDPTNTNVPNPNCGFWVLSGSPRRAVISSNGSARCATELLRSTRLVAHTPERWDI